MVKGRNSTGFGLRMQDGLLAEIEDIARRRGLTRNELIVELVKLGLEKGGENSSPEPRAVVVKGIGLGKKVELARGYPLAEGLSRSYNIDTEAKDVKEKT